MGCYLSRLQAPLHFVCESWAQVTRCLMVRRRNVDVWQILLSLENGGTKYHDTHMTFIFLVTRQMDFVFALSNGM